MLILLQNEAIMSRSIKQPKMQWGEHRKEPVSSDDGSLRGVGDDGDVVQSDHSSKSYGHIAPRGSQSEAGQEGNSASTSWAVSTSLEDGQLRGVDEDGQIIQGTHGGPQRNKGMDATTRRKS